MGAKNIKLGGDKRDRTADLLHAMQALSQLSYTPLISTTELKSINCEEVKLCRSLFDYSSFFQKIVIGFEQIQL